MKKQLLALLLVLFAVVVTAEAQEYKKWKVGLGLGYAAPADGGGGVAVYLEPAYRVNDQIAVGLRLESAALAKVVGDEEASISGNASYTVNGQYYLSDSKFRPFVGAGIGIFSLASISVSTTGTSGDISAGGDTKFGFYPRVGFDLGHFNFIFDYNLVGNSELPGVTVDNNGNTTTSNVDVKNSYFAVKLGFSIGGGNN
ncbi:MAG: outer membrane beta-barrel protein [Bacteroidota bacterium]